MSLTAKKKTSSRPAWGFRRIIIDTTESAGAALHEARLAKKWLLADCAASLKIPEKYLRAIEEENLTQLPGLVYEKHFIYRYALALGISPAPLVSGWITLRQDSIAPSTQFVARVHWRDLWVSPFFWRRAMAGVAIVLVGAYIGGRLLVMVRPPVLTITSPEEAMMTVERTVVVSGTTEQETKVTINGEAVPTRRDGSFAVPLTLQPGANTVRIAAAKRYSRTAVIERRVFVAASSPVSDKAAEASVVLGALPH